MSIQGQQFIDIGAENQLAGSDSLYTAFNKIQNNFTTLFNTASPYNRFNGANGISTVANAATGTITITNTGVRSLSAGTGITLTNTTGDIIISASGEGNVGVTSVGITSNTLSISNTPIVSSGNISVNLPVIMGIAGEYTAPSVTVDDYGRITSIANTVSLGTVTSVAIEAEGTGLQVTSSPITSDGIIKIKNTGVVSITPGPGISVSDNSGDITISSTLTNDATVSRVEVSSNTLIVTGSPITTTGEIIIDLPDNLTSSGTHTANIISANLSLISDGTLSVAGSATLTNVSLTSATGNFSGTFNGSIGNILPSTGSFTTITASANINTAANVNAVAMRANVFSGFEHFVANQGYIAMQNNLGNFIVLRTPPSANNIQFILPGNDGNPYGVLGTNGQGRAAELVENPNRIATLGWKTIATQYFSVLLRDGVSSVFAPSDVIRRSMSILLNDGGTYTDVQMY
jgi:hypothetical protein